MSVRQLNKLDVVISIYNQENLIRRVLYGIFKNTTTPFNLILVFDGCTDKTKSRALSFIKKHKSKLLQKFITTDTPNVFETRANNIGFRLAKEGYMITVQDDMVIKEFGWEKRLTYPLRKFDDVLAVTARSAHDIKRLDAETEDYINIAAKEHGALPRDIFAVRDIINRGPVAFRMDYLRKLNYLNEDYAPLFLDEADLSLRAWTRFGWKVGSFWIKYLSRNEWGKTRSKNTTINTGAIYSKNAQKISIDFADYLKSGAKHTENIKIPESEIDHDYTWTFRLKQMLYGFYFPICLNSGDLKYAILWPKKTLKNLKKRIAKIV